MIVVFITLEVLVLPDPLHGHNKVGKYTNTHTHSLCVNILIYKLII